MDDLRSRLATAREVAQAAAQIAREAYLGDIGAVRSKGSPHNLVTATDEAVERMIAAELLAAHPADGLVGEEATSDCPSESGVTWAIDPVDGTWNFANGIPHWCVVVACADEHGPAVGVIADPMRGELWSAVRGGGVELNGRPLIPRELEDDPNAVTWALSLGDGFRELRWQRLRGRLGPVRITGSLALDLAWTAAGRFAAFAYSCSAAPWDIWAGEVMARERGLDIRAEPENGFDAVLPQGWWDRLGLEQD